ncbi:MAG: hypothetical protein SFV32_14630 [Opitutaceae bacterium]|nr:hypothetical protein [Opitutaceae bacterium]
MRYYLASLLVLLHVLFWGLGLAWCVTPRVWRRYWLLFVPLCGWTLQSLVVWVGAWAGLNGTESYAAGALLIPSALLIGSWFSGMSRDLASSFRASWHSLALMLVAAAVLLLPLALASERLTTQSWGSCDAADYAAGARVFQEYSRDDRSGFLGLAEVVRVGSTEDFFRFWLRLNHFTPSAVLALNNSVFGFRIHESVGLMTVLFIATTAPACFAALRIGLGAPFRVALLASCITVLGPVMTYALSHVAMAQVLATQGVAILAGVAAGVWRLRRNLPVRAIPLLCVAFALLLGAYNFILLVALAPAAARLLADFGRRKLWSELASWAWMLAAAFAVSAIIWWDRTAGIIERFQLFRETDFGWKVPLVTPEGVLGLVNPVDLVGLPWLVRAAASAALVVAAVTLLKREQKARQRYVLAVVAVLPVVAGYAYLHTRGATLGTNASYDAYKILAVFLPWVVAAVIWPFCLLASTRMRRLVGLVLVTVVAAHAFLFANRFRRAPYLVTDDIASLGSLEKDQELGSLNMRIDDFWTRLWANAFLLRKEQYFLETTYEGRSQGPLKGSHDLQHGLLGVGVTRDEIRGAGWPVGMGQIESGSLAPATRTRAPFTVAKSGELLVQWGNGWYGLEGTIRSGPAWRWMGATGSVRVQSAHQQIVDWHLRLKAPRDASLEFSSTNGWSTVLAVQEGIRDYVVRGVPVPEGPSEWSLKSAEGAQAPGNGDRREVSVALMRWQWESRMARP